jgi:protoheme IX farnesyltransferase
MTSVWTLDHCRTQGLARVIDYLELTKPRISILVLATVAVAGLVAGAGEGPELTLMVHAVMGTALVAASGSALNQWLERHRDALMERTANRPLPAGRLSSAEVLIFVVATLVGGIGYLAVTVGWLTAVLAATTWLLYTAVYTPLKPRTSLNTAVGALAGAMPVAIGWSAVGSPWDLRVAALLLVLFFWQFPHFMSIAWLYRQQYARAGIKMLTVVDPTGRRAGILATSVALILLPISVVPGMGTPAAGVHAVMALVLSTAQLICAAGFLLRQNERSARRLLRASLIYLPAILGLLVLLPWAWGVST